MKTLIGHALKECARKKELYILAGLSLLLLLFLSSNSATITIDSEPSTGFERMLPLILRVVNASVCLLALVLSVNTIPEQYRSKNSHLVWVRGISQPVYHVSLAVANFLAAAFAAVLLFAALGLYLVGNGEAQRLPLLLPSLLLLLINTATVTALTSALSIVFSPLLTGSLVFLITAAELFAPVLSLISTLTEGNAATALRLVLRGTPNLDALQEQAAAVIFGQTPDLHILFTALVWLYGISLLFFVLRKKEA